MEWYPTPSYLVKRRVILEYLAQHVERYFLEVGCGCGDLLHVLEKNGYTGLGIDISESSLAVASSGLAHGRVRVKCSLPEDIDGEFEIVIASEVMEHHQDDLTFLNTLKARLCPGGHLLLTVPAHMADWGPNDDFCGHIRRYERRQLNELLQSAGFEKIVISSYGVPIYNVMKPLYDSAIRSKNAKDDLMNRTAESGGMWLMKSFRQLFHLLFNDVTMYPLYLLQRIFYSTDLGKGYFVAARKKEPV